MAYRFPAENKVQLRARRGHDMTWSCDIHGDPIKFYCKEHVIPICHPCATKDHQKPCHLENIEDVILETQKKLEDSQKKITEAKERLKAIRCKIESSATSSTNHLQSVNDDVHATYDGKLKSLKDKEQDEIRLINEEADEEMRIINEKRNRRIKACKQEIEKRQVTIKKSEVKLISDIKAINEKVKNKIQELRRKNQHDTDMLDNMDSKIVRIKKDDQTLVNEAPQVIASLDESLSSNVYQEVADYLDQIEREVQRVKFFEGEVGGEHYGRIDGYIGTWELVKSIDIPLFVDEPEVCGLINDNEVCVLNAIGNALYVTNISTEHTKEVNQGDRQMGVLSCAPIDSNFIVCAKWRGRCRGTSLDGCITLYDRKWKVIRDITIPKDRPTSSRSSTVYVDVDIDGLILAAQSSQSNIYVINPADGKILNTITMHGTKVLGRIHSLSSGDIVVQAGGDKFTVISRSGERKAAIHCDEWKWPTYCYIDKLTDTLYIRFHNRKRTICAVDQVSFVGNIQSRRIVVYKRSDRDFYISPRLVTPSGTLVGCDNDRLFVYKKSFIV